jgi:hypothetical protein
MLKRYLLSVVIVFILWSVLDFVLHGVILSQAYQATAQLWRSMEEMKTGLMYLSSLLTAAAFVGAYALLAADKSVKTGTLYGIMMGLFSGIPMALGSYSYMPITCYIALVWFCGSVILMTLAGLCIGAIFKKQ